MRIRQSPFQPECKYNLCQALESLVIYLTIYNCTDDISFPKNKAWSEINKDLRPITLTATLSKTYERFAADYTAKNAQPVLA